ncbi:MAG TPA: T9SS type A sorting domain-containing protein [Chitinophagales bacterium]|nr:T9SS type A sorting domain-containing protein [Chitinophagales bacterium]
MSIKKIFAYALPLLFGVRFSHSQTPTWSGSVASVIYNHCSSCHHAGGIGPFTLMSYADAVNHAANIQSYVQARKMPPWMPNPGYSHFKGERLLSDSDINTIVDWVNGGTLAGDTTQAPAPPVFLGGSQMPSIDQSIQFPEWTINSNIDQYRTFVVHSNYAQDFFLNQIEYLPGNGSVVHHMVLFYDTSATSWDLDQSDPQPGYESYGLGPLSGTARTISAWAPGSGIFELPWNMGIRIPAGADIGLEIHYSPNESGQTDSTAVNFKFTTYPFPREVYSYALLNHESSLTDGPLYIPANTVKTFHEKYKLLNYFGPVSLVSIFPHMHKVGTSIQSFAVDAGGDTTKLISIPNWNFHWQGFYEFQKLIPVMTQSTLWGEATYDNTTNNPDNPNDPPQDVSAGGHTTDEMMIFIFAFLAYEAGDENLILDSTIASVSPNVHEQKLPMHVYPNPVLDELNVGTELKKSTALSFSLLNAEGQISRAWKKSVPGGAQAFSFSLKGLSPGIYFLKAVSPEGYAITKVIKQ